MPVVVRHDVNGNATKTKRVRNGRETRTSNNYLNLKATLSLKTLGQIKFFKAKMLQKGQSGKAVRVRKYEMTSNIFQCLYAAGYYARSTRFDDILTILLKNTT